MELLDALDLAVAEFRRRLVDVPDGAWSRPTPCAGWDVRYLVAHVVGGSHFAVLVLDGASAEEAMGVVLRETSIGAQPIDDHDDIARRQRAAFRRTGALEALVDHPGGPITGREFLGMRVFDVAVHAWDLARAVDADDRLDPDLVQTVLDVLDAMPTGPGFGIVPIGVATGADSPQVQLLDRCGRRRGD